jgi:hypothetical protein
MNLRASLSLLAFFLLFSCQKDNVIDEQPYEFTIKLGTVESASGRMTDLNLDGASFLLVTITKEDGSPTDYTQQKIELYQVGSEFISEKLSLPVGHYNLTELFVTDSENNITHIAPLEGSEQAQNVNDPLPIEFIVSTDQITSVNVEVISSEDLSLEDFGLVGFHLSQVGLFNFLVAISEQGNNESLLDGTITIVNEDYQFSQELLAIANNSISVKDGLSSYELTIEKEGYQPFSYSFTRDSLGHYDAAPLLIELVPNAEGIQTFSSSFGGTDLDRAERIIQTDDGSYAVFGWVRSIDGDVTNNRGASDMWLIKLDDSGGLLWEKSYGGAATEYGYDFDLTSDGGFIIAGDSYSSDGDVPSNAGQHDALVLKLDRNGSIEWSRVFGGSLGETFQSVIETSDGGYVLAGFTRSSDGDFSGNYGESDLLILKLDGSGNLLWQKSYGGAGSDIAREVRQTSDGEFVVVGETNSTNGHVTESKGGLDVWLLKLDSSGDLIWQKSYGGSGNDWGTSINIASNGNYAIGGISASGDGDVTGAHGIDDFWVLLVDVNGNLQWQNALGGSYRENCFSIDQMSDGGFVATGYTQSVDGDISETLGSWDIWIVKLDGLGNLVWEKSHGGEGTDLAYSICTTQDGGLAVTGFISNVGTNNDYWILKLDSKGELY